MRRRTAVTTIACVLVPGCIGRGVSIDGQSNDDGTSYDGRYSGLTFSEVRPDEVDRDYIDYEYVEIQNTSNESIDPQGVTVQYATEITYEIGDVDLPPGSHMVIRSRNMPEARLETDPPVLLRSAAFGEEPQTSVMGSPGTVELLSPDGELIDEYEY